MPLSLPDRALLVKLFYVNSSNAVAALREFRHVKGMRKGKGPVTPCSLRRMITKFEETGSFSVKCGRGRKPVPLPIQEEIASAIVESSGTQEPGPSARGVARELDIPYATVRKILRKTKCMTATVMAQVVLGREIQNKFPDFDGSRLVYDPQTQKLKIDVETAVYENACKLLRVLERELSSGTDQNPSVYTGESGIALLYLHLMDVSQFKDKSILLASGLKHVEEVLPYLRKKRYTFLCGDTGPQAVGAVLYHRANMEEKKNDLIKRIVKFSRKVSSVDPNEYNELLYGRAGYLFTLLFMRKYLGESSVSGETVREVVSAIIHAGKTHSHKIRHRCPLYYEWHDKAYIGSAHGFAGILYMLLQAKDFLTDEEMNQLVKPSIDYVFSLKFPSGNFPSSLGNNTDKLIHWCHGAPGVIYMMLLAYEVFGDSKYLTAAKECGEVIWERGLLKKGYGICHGVAGNGYGFLRLFQVTKDEKYLYRAVKFAEWCFDYGKHNCNTPDHPLSLFEGLAGTVYFLSDLLDPLHAAFPAFQLF